MRELLHARLLSDHSLPTNLDAHLHSSLNCIGALLVPHLASELEAEAVPGAVTLAPVDVPIAEPPKPESTMARLKKQLDADGLTAIEGMNGAAIDQLRLQYFQRELAIAGSSQSPNPASKSEIAWKFLPFILAFEPSDIVDTLIGRLARGEISISDHPLAVRAVARQAPERLLELAQLPDFMTPDTAYAFARFAPRDVAAQILNLLTDHPNHSRLSIAMAADPACVAGRLRNTWDDQLLYQLNFCETASLPEDLVLLEEGFWFVGPHLRAAEDRSAWRNWIGEVFDNPEMLGSHPNPGILSGIGRELFIHKLREQEKLLLDQDLNRFTLPARLETRRLGEFLLFPPDMLHRHMVTRGDALTHSTSMDAYQDRIVLETARALLEPHVKAALRRQLDVKGFWHCASKAPPDRVDSVSVFGKEVQDIDTVLKLGVLTPVRFPRKVIYDSPGAKAAVLFAGHFSLDLSSPLALAEQQAKLDTPRCGTELQVFLPHNNLHLAPSFRAALASLGLPMPKRFGMERVVEAAIPPSTSFVSQLVALGLLGKFGLPNGADELAVHVSLQGSLLREAAAIAFPQLIATWAEVVSTGHRPLYRTTSTLLSKGLIHLNSKVIPATPNEKPTCRTEFRVIRGGRTRSFESVLQSTFETIVLGYACTSTDARLQKVWDGYVDDLATALRTAPAELRELFECNWFEASGDAFDFQLTESLDVYKLLGRIRGARLDYVDLSNVLRPIVTRSVREAVLLLGHTGTNWSFLADCDLAFLIPQLGV